MIDEFLAEGVGAAQDAAVSRTGAEFFRIELARGGDNAEEAVVALHDEALHIVLLLGGHFAGAIEHVFELSTFENHGFEADFSKEVAVVQRGNDHADAAGEGRVVAHDPIRPAGHVVGSGGADGVEINDHGFVGIEVPDRIIEHIGGGDLAAGRVGLDHHGLHIGIGGGLFERELEILDHGIAKAALGLEGDDAGERDDGDFVVRIAAFLDDLLIVFTGLQNCHARHRGRALRPEQGEENEVREKAHANGHKQEGHKTSGFFHGWKLWIIWRAPPSLVVQSVRPVA